MVRHCVNFRIKACEKLNCSLSGSRAVLLVSSESHKCWLKQLFQTELNMPVIVHADEMNAQNSTLTSVQFSYRTG